MTVETVEPRTPHPAASSVPVGTRRGRPLPRGAARWILSGPLLLFLLLFTVFPTIYGLWISLTDRSILRPDGSFVGVDNFAQTLADEQFWQALWFTVGFTAVTTLGVLITGFALALLMNRHFPGKKVLFTAILLPIMVAPALMGLMFRLTLNADIGPVARLLESLGIGVTLFRPDAIAPLLVTLEVVQWTPFVFLICYAGLQSMPADLFEAVALDGAGRIQTFLSLTLPLMRPVLFTAGFLRGVDALRTFDVIYILTGGGPGTTTTTLTIYIYKQAIVTGNFGLGTAASVVVLIVMLPLVPVVMRRIIAQPGEIR